MRILFDHNLPRRFRKQLTSHDVRTSRQMGWEALDNGDLLQAAAAEGFDAFLSIDKNIRYQQNLSKLPISVIILDCPSNAFPVLVPFAPHVEALLKGPLERVLYVLKADGSVARLGSSSRRQGERKAGD